MFEPYLLIPAVIVVALIEWRRRRISAQDPASEKRALFQFSLGVWFGLIVLLILGNLAQQRVWEFWVQLSNSSCDSAPAFPLLGLYGCYRLIDIFRNLTTPHILVPALTGLILSLSFFWPGRAAATRLSWVLVGLAAAALFLYAILRGSLELVITVILPVLFVLLAWHLPRWGRWGRIAGLLALAVLAVFAWLYLYRQDLIFNPSMMGGAALIITIGILFLFPLTTGIVTAMAMQAILLLGQKGFNRRQLFLVLVALAMLAFTMYLLFLEVLWDAATDDMSQLMIPWMCLFGAIAGAVAVAISLPSQRKPGVLIFSLALLLLLILPRDRWMFADKQAVTDGWGERIAQAVERYHARSGRYPASLNELVPFDIWRIQRPFVYRDEDWCYQAGEDYYRLGYVYRPAFGVPAQYISIRMVRSAGTPPAGPWACDAALARKQQNAPIMQRPPG